MVNGHECIFLQETLSKKGTYQHYKYYDTYHSKAFLRTVFLDSKIAATTTLDRTCQLCACVCGRARVWSGACVVGRVVGSVAVWLIMHSPPHPAN